MKNTQEFLDAVRLNCQEAQTFTDAQIIDIYRKLSAQCSYSGFAVLETSKEIENKKKDFLKKIDWQNTFNGEATNWDTYNKVANFAKMCGYKHLWWNNYLFENI